MKSFIISTLDTMLSIAVVLSTLGGFLIAGNINPFGEFQLGLALAGGLSGFFLSVVMTGGIFTLIRIQELLERQVQTSTDLAHYIRSYSFQSKPNSGDIATTSSQVTSPSTPTRSASIQPRNVQAESRPATSAALTPNIETLTEIDKAFLRLISAEPSLADDLLADRLQISSDTLLTLRANLRGRFQVFRHSELVQEAKKKDLIP